MTRLFRDHDDRLPLDQLGSKAGKLAALRKEKLLIPPWFVVGAEEGPLSEADGRAIIAMAREVAPQAKSFAVRSSAFEEDGVEHSYAGQLQSYLFVPIADIPARVEEVRRSAMTEDVEYYRTKKKLSGSMRVPAVLVMPMIEPTASGVAFSADPVLGRRGMAVVTAVADNGFELVAGVVDADHFRIDRQGRIVTSETKSGSESRIHGARPERSITDAQAIAVATLARRVERICGRPQDIEWVYEGTKLWLLQARPITAIAGLADPDGEVGLWDNANIAESYSGVTTPLTFSFARGIYEAVYREFARLMGVSVRRIDGNRDLFPRMLGLIEGRIYYNLVSWYRLLALLPGFAVNRGFMEQMMGVKEGLPPEILARIAPPAIGGARLRDALAFGRSCLGLLRNHLTLRSQIRRFYARLEQALRPGSLPLANLRPDELVAHYRDLERQLLLRWDAPLVNDFFAMVFYGVLRRLTAKWCGDADGTLQNDLICGEGGMISAEPAQRVRELAALLSRHPAAVALFCDGPLDDIVEWLETAPEFRQRYESYLTKFGDRCLEELKLESPTLHDEPLTLLRSIGQYARRFGTPGQAGEAGLEARLRREAEAKADRALGWRPVRGVIFNWVLKHARARVRDRENLRFERTRLFGHVRRICLELGRRLHATGRLADPRDIFWLTMEEVLGFVEGTTPTVSLAPLAALRKEEFARYRADAGPDGRFSTRGGVHFGNTFRAGREPVPSDAASLRGLGCCPGIVRGPARVIVDPRNAEIEPGEILVAPRTDPGWIMLFPAAAGLVVEHGSLLSHSAIVARELGIPAIVSVGGLTRWVTTGEWLEMDGSTGVVRKYYP